MRRTGRSRWAGTLFLLALGLLHRVAVFAVHSSDLERLISKNPDWLTWQLLPIAALRDHLAASLFFLQQTPPLPNLLLGILAKVATWPFEVNYALIGLQGALSIATAILMFRLQLLLAVRAAPALVAPSVFLMSSDLVLMEYNSEGQTFYENLAMLLVLVVAWLFVRLERSGLVRYSLLLGLATGVLALTRATFSYFFLVPMLFLFALGLRRLPRQILAFALCGVGLQLAWCSKNALLYDRFSLRTSSWTGTNFAAGLHESGTGGYFLDSILEDPASYPSWFIAMSRQEGLILWTPAYERYLPDAIADRDRQKQEALGGTAPATDSLGQKAVSDLYLRAYARFAREHPELVLRKVRRSYSVFWQPIRNYAHQFVDLFYVKPVVVDPFDFGAILSQLVNREIPEQQYLMARRWTGRPKPARARKTSTWSLAVLPTLYGMRNIIALHLLAPVLLVGVASRRLSGKGVGLPVSYLFMLATIAYVAVVGCLSEFSENMRFRLSVEPLVWLSGGWGFRALHDLLRAARQRRQGSRAPLPSPSGRSR